MPRHHSLTQSTPQHQKHLIAATHHSSDRIRASIARGSRDFHGGNTLNAFTASNSVSPSFVSASNAPRAFGDIETSRQVLLAARKASSRNFASRTCAARTAYLLASSRRDGLGGHVVFAAHAA